MAVQIWQVDKASCIVAFLLCNSPSIRSIFLDSKGHRIFFFRLQILARGVRFFDNSFKVSLIVENGPSSLLNSKQKWGPRTTSSLSGFSRTSCRSFKTAFRVPTSLILWKYRVLNQKLVNTGDSN